MGLSAILPPGRRRLQEQCPGNIVRWCFCRFRSWIERLEWPEQVGSDLTDCRGLFVACRLGRLNYWPDCLDCRPDRAASRLRLLCRLCFVCSELGFVMAVRLADVRPLATVLRTDVTGLHPILVFAALLFLKVPGRSSAVMLLLLVVLWIARIVLRFRKRSVFRIVAVMWLLPTVLRTGKCTSSIAM